MDLAEILRRGYEVLRLNEEAHRALYKNRPGAHPHHAAGALQAQMAYDSSRAGIPVNILDQSRRLIDRLALAKKGEMPVDPRVFEYLFMRYWVASHSEDRVERIREFHEDFRNAYAYLWVWNRIGQYGREKSQDGLRFPLFKEQEVERPLFDQEGLHPDDRVKPVAFKLPLAFYEILSELTERKEQMTPLWAWFSHLSQAERERMENDHPPVCRFFKRFFGDAPPTPDRQVSGMEPFYQSEDGRFVIWCGRTVSESRAIGNGSELCTAYTDTSTHAKRYLALGPLYAFWIDGRCAFQFHPATGEFTDPKNKPVSVASVRLALQGIENYTPSKVVGGFGRPLLFLGDKNPLTHAEFEGWCRYDLLPKMLAGSRELMPLGLMFPYGEFRQELEFPVSGRAEEEARAVLAKGAKFKNRKVEALSRRYALRVVFLRTLMRLDDISKIPEQDRIHFLRAAALPEVCNDFSLMGDGEPLYAFASRRYVNRQGMRAAAAKIVESLIDGEKPQHIPLIVSFLTRRDYNSRGIDSLESNDRLGLLLKIYDRCSLAQKRRIARAVHNKIAMSPVIVHEQILHAFHDKTFTLLGKILGSSDGEQIKPACLLLDRLNRSDFISANINTWRKTSPERESLAARVLAAWEEQGGGVKSQRPGGARKHGQNHSADC